MPGIVRAAYTEESAEVEVLFANMEKLKDLTKKIQSSLTRLDATGESVQDALRPIYGGTSKLQVTNSNINRINEAIEKIKEPLDRKRGEEPIIGGGLQKYPLPEYLASIDRTNRALEDLKHSNLKSNQQAIADLNDLLRYSSQELEAVFQDTLREEAHPVVPLHFLTKNLPFPALSTENSSKLRTINQYVMTSPAKVFQTGEKDSRTARMYAEVRGPYLAASLRDPATASINTVRKRNPDAAYKRGDCVIGSYATAMEGLFVAEYDNISSIFGREQSFRLHTQTCQDALKEFTGTLRELHTHIKNNPITDCFLAYEIIEIVSDLASRIEARNADLKQPIHDAMRPIRESAKSSLPRLLEDTRSRIQNLASLPVDSSPVDTTKDTVSRLVEMTYYLGPLSSILASVGESGWRSPQPPRTSSSSTAPTIGSIDFRAHGRELFGSYAADTLEALSSGLEMKARALIKSRPAQGIFIANNVAVIERHMEKSDLGSLLPASARTKLEKLREKGINMYADAWKETTPFLLDVQYTNRGSQGMGGRPPSGSPGQIDSAAFVKALTSKDRDATKEKFKNFNTSFDELIAKHKTYRMEKEVREASSRIITKMIEPLYTRFWDRYHELDKGKGKYVKYDKAQLSRVLAGLA